LSGSINEREVRDLAGKKKAVKKATKKKK